MPKDKKHMISVLYPYQQRPETSQHVTEQSSSSQTVHWSNPLGTIH